MALHLEYLGSLLADLTTKFAIAPLVDILTNKGKDKLGSMLDDKHRKAFGFIVSQMKEPFRSKINNLYREAREGKIKGFSEDAFVRLLMKVIENCDLEAQLEYFYKVAQMRHEPQSDPSNPEITIPSIEEELDKQHHNVIQQFASDAAKAARRAKEKVNAELSEPAAELKSFNDKWETWLHSKINPTIDLNKREDDTWER